MDPSNGTEVKDNPRELEQELNVLRKVARAARTYQELIIKKRNLQLLKGMDQREFQGTLLDIGSAEFELSEALNEWSLLLVPNPR